MEPSNRSDAFSQTLDKIPHPHRISMNYKNNNNNAINRGNSVNRLSRAFEIEQPQPQQKLSDASPSFSINKPQLPNKPSSLRSRPTSMIVSPTPTRLSQECFNNKLENTLDNDNNNDSSIDNTSMTFQDIRARFQQQSLNNDEKSSSPKRHSLKRLSYTTPPVIQKPDTPNGKNTNTLPSQKPRAPPPQIKQRPTSFLSEFHNHNQQEKSQENEVHSPSPIIMTSNVKLPSSSSPFISKPLVPKRPSQNTLKMHRLQQDGSTLNIPNNNNNNNNEDHHSSIRLLPRSGTGNSMLSISSATTSSTSSAATTPSSPKRPWNNYSNTIANWFALNNNNNNNESSSSMSTSHISSPISLPIQQQNHTGSSLLHPSINLKPSISSSSSTSSSTTTPIATFQNDHHHDPSVSSPFDQPPPSNPAIAPQLSGMTTSSQNSLQGLLQQQESKKNKVINELLETEKIYCNDMIVLKEVYYDQANLLLLQNEDRHHQQQPFSSSDIKIIFSNLLAIIEFETIFVDLLKDAISLQQDKNGQFLSIGMVFRNMMQQIDHVYCDYCKRHEDAVCRLQELDAKPNVQQFLKTCSEQLHGRTQSWDIGSMLIKPVQRVLKYPLLLKVN
ncbi:hypothetical protein BJ944DRAFT_73012 [Cunninghamella echinulata]|nr:hypothetical protein BJ944DRAFT_73012 [Cunninghamella echinulata]